MIRRNKSARARHRPAIGVCDHHDEHLQYGLVLTVQHAGFNLGKVAAGHGMFGLSLTPTSSLALSELVMDGRSSIDLSDFNPDRFTVGKLLRAS